MADTIQFKGSELQNIEGSLINGDKTAFFGIASFLDSNRSLIKLLEIKFKTTLGFPSKLCNSQGTYGCNSTDRAKFWMSFLKEKGLLKLSHNTPISFSFYDR